MAIVVCHRQFLESRCAQRGVPIDSAMACVVKADGDVLSVDTSHPAYPATRPAMAAKGAGTELKKLLAKIGITAEGDCKCNKRAAYINQMGIEWAEQNIDEIVGYLRESAQERGLPFVDMAGRVLVKRAIHNAKKATLE